jgi:protein SCO1/2
MRWLSLALASCFGAALLLGCGPTGAVLDAREDASAAGGERRTSGKPSDRFSNIWLTTQHGERVRFYDDLVRDKAVMINFMYTTCSDICPGMGAQLARFNDLLGERAGRDISLLSISMDPEVDTPEQLKLYWQAFGSRPGWLFLTGDYDEIDQLRHDLGIYDPDPVIDADKTQHAGIVTFGNDRTDRWAALPALSNLRDLARAVKRFTWDEEWSHPVPSVASQLAEPATHDARGVVFELLRERNQVAIAHDEIQGLMPAMTMAFELSDADMLEGLAPGQPVEFSIEHRPGGYQIVKIAALRE